MSHAPENPVSGPSPRRTVIPEQARWHGRLAAHLIHLAASSLAASIRWHWIDDGGLARARQGPVLFAVWHNRLALALPIYQRVIHGLPRRQMAALVSASRDGGLLAHVLTLFHVRPVRGSSSRRGARALLELTAAARDGCDLALTPDGPRGPRYHVQEGVILAAQLTGLPIVPVSCWLGWKKTFNSWDRFQLPLPGSRCQVRFHPPLLIPTDTTTAQRETFRANLERQMQTLSHDGSLPTDNPPHNPGSPPPTEQPAVPSA